MMKKILFLLFLLLPINLFALESYVVMDGESGRVLASSNKDEKMLIASTTKIMTTVVALENADTTNVVCAKDEIKSVYGSMIYLEENECMTLYDLLVGLMLRSGNDAAMVIATNTLGYDKFIDKMNETASRIGMKNTLFENPHGLDDESKNTSTAYDLALLMRYAMENKVFREITSTKKFTTSSSIKTHLWLNKNKLLSTYKYATGGKIGYTTKSGHIFVSSSSKASENLIVVTMKDEDQFNTHKNLYEKYYKTYDKYKVLDRYTFLLSEDYYKDYHLYIKEDVNIMLSKEDKIDIKFEIIKKKEVKSKDVVGYAKVYVNDEYITEAKIYALKNENKDISLKRRILNLFKTH